MKVILVLILFSANLFSGIEGLWRIWVSSFSSIDDVKTILKDCQILNSARPQPPENFSYLFNVSTNTVPLGISIGSFKSEIVLDEETKEGLISGHPDLEKLSSVKKAMEKGWIIRVGTKTWNNKGWVRDENFKKFNKSNQRIRSRFGSCNFKKRRSNTRYFSKVY